MWGDLVHTSSHAQSHAPTSGTAFYGTMVYLHRKIGMFPSLPAPQLRAGKAVNNVVHVVGNLGRRRRLCQHPQLVLVTHLGTAERAGHALPLLRLGRKTRKGDIAVGLEKRRRYRCTTTAPNCFERKSSDQKVDSQLTDDQRRPPITPKIKTKFAIIAKGARPPNTPAKTTGQTNGPRRHRWWPSVLCSTGRNSRRSRRGRRRGE